jgi:hypothetical protein
LHFTLALLIVSSSSETIAKKSLEIILFNKEVSQELIKKIKSKNTKNFIQRGKVMIAYEVMNAI